MTRSHKFLAFAAALAFAIAPISMADAQSRSSTPSYSAPSRPSTPSYSAPSRPSTPSYSAPPRASTPAAPAASTPRRDPPAASNGGYTRPTVATPPTAVAPPPAPATAQRAQPTPNPSGFSRPAAVGVGAAAVGVGVVAATSPATASERQTPPPAQNGITAAQARSASTDTLRAYRAERESATRPPQPVARTEVRQNPVFTDARRSYGGNTDAYMRQRTIDYGSYRDRHPEVFRATQNMQPNYGIFDSNFLTGMMMGVIGTSLYDRATWMNSQQTQPWYPQYRSDLERQARDNADLRYRLDEMDREMARVRAANNHVTVSALPAGVSPSIAIAPEAVIADADDSGMHWAIWLIIGITMLALCYVGYIVYSVYGRRRI